MSLSAPFLEMPLVTVVNHQGYLVVEYAENYSCDVVNKNELMFKIIEKQGNAAGYKLFPLAKFGVVKLLISDQKTWRTIKVVDRKDESTHQVGDHEEAPFIYFDQLNLDFIYFVSFVINPEKWVLQERSAMYNLQNSGNHNTLETTALFRKRIPLGTQPPKLIIFNVEGKSGNDKQIIVNTSDGSVGDRGIIK